MSIKSLSIRIEEEMLEKLYIVADYQVAKKYIVNLDILDVTEAFSKIDESKRFIAAEKYLASSHKVENL